MSQPWLGERWYNPTDHFPAEAARVGRHMLRLLTEDIAIGDMAPANFTVGGELPDSRVQTVGLSVAPNTARRLETGLGRRLFLGGGHRLIGMSYKVDFYDDDPDGAPARTLTVSNHPNWITGEWAPDSPSDTIHPVDGGQIREDITRILGITPYRRFESLDPASRLPAREARVIIGHMAELLRAKRYADHGWGQETPDGGYIEMLAVKDDGPLRGMVKYDPAEGSAVGPFRMHWNVGVGRQNVGRGVVLLHNDLHNDRTALERSQVGWWSRDNDVALSLSPFARHDVIDLVVSSITPESELPQI